MIISTRLPTVLRDPINAYLDIRSSARSRSTCHFFSDHSTWQNLCRLHYGFEPVTHAKLCYKSAAFALGHYKPLDPKEMHQLRVFSKENLLLPATYKRGEVPTCIFYYLALLIPNENSDAANLILDCICRALEALQPDYRVLRLEQRLQAMRRWEKKPRELGNIPPGEEKRGTKELPVAATTRERFFALLDAISTNKHNPHMAGFAHHFLAKILVQTDPTCQFHMTQALESGHPDACFAALKAQKSSELITDHKAYLAHLSKAANGGIGEACDTLASLLLIHRTNKYSLPPIGQRVKPILDLVVIDYPDETLAEKAAHAYLQMNPSSSLFLSHIAPYHCRQRQYDLAFSTIEKYLLATPRYTENVDNFQAIQALGSAYFNGGHFDYSHLMNKKEIRIRPMTDKSPQNISPDPEKAIDCLQFLLRECTIYKNGLALQPALKLLFTYLERASDPKQKTQAAYYFQLMADFADNECSASDILMVSARLEKLDHSMAKIWLDLANSKVPVPASPAPTDDSHWPMFVVTI